MTLINTKSKKHMPAPTALVKDANNHIRFDPAAPVTLTNPLSVSIDTGVVRVYQQSEDGGWEELKPSTTDGGYIAVWPRCLNSDGKAKRRICYVHRLVATVYCDNPFGNNYVDHIDGDRQNNTPSNLRWVTMRENQLYRRIHEMKKLKDHNRGHRRDSLKRGRYLKLSRADYAEPLYFDTITDAAKAIGCTSQNINMCLRRGYRPVGWTVEYVNIED